MVWRTRHGNTTDVCSLSSILNLRVPMMTYNQYHLECERAHLLNGFRSKSGGGNDVSTISYLLKLHCT